MFKKCYVGLLGAGKLIFDIVIEIDIDASDFGL